MNLILQRFQPGYIFYTDKTITNGNDKLGIVGTFKTVFGRYLTSEGKTLCYSMERLDTLISEGIRKFKYYDSPENKMQVLLLEDEPMSNTFDRKLEVHPANWVYQLKGCNSPGMNININVPEIENSRYAFDLIKKYLNGTTGTFTIEKFIQSA